MKKLTITLSLLLCANVFFMSATTVESTKTFSIFPNEVQENFVVNYTLEETTNVRITLHSTEGKELKELLDDIQVAGSHHLLLNTDLPSGIYFINVTILDKTSSQKLIVK